MYKTIDTILPSQGLKKKVMYPFCSFHKPQQDKNIYRKPGCLSVIWKEKEIPQPKPDIIIEP